jgi:hypothetical protein
MPGPYQYKFGSQDNPLTVAEQFGTTPQALIQANPGGYPFSTGQLINVPNNAPIGPQPFTPTATFQYSAPIGPQPPTLLQQRMSANQTQNPLGGVGTQPYGPVVSPTPNWQDRAALGVDNGYAPASMLNIIRKLSRGEDVDLSAVDPTQRKTIENLMQSEAAKATAAAGGTPSTLAEGDFYGYTRDPETGRSVRVIKNSSSASLLNEMRWDKQARKYVSVGRLMRQGKLRLDGSWSNSSNRQRRSAAIQRKQQQQTQKEDYTLANSLISFSSSSG